MTKNVLFFTVILVILLMIDVIALSSWVNFHYETRTEVLWSYGYYERTQYLNGKPYYGDGLFPLSSEGLERLGIGMRFYFKTLDSEYQNVTYYYSYQTHDSNTTKTDGAWSRTVDEFSVSICWTYRVSVCDVPRLLFVIILSIVVLVLILLILSPYVKEAS
jgi:hypothetical protein